MAQPEPKETDYLTLCGLKLEDTNVAGIGGAEDKALRKAAAETEPAWTGCGLLPDGEKMNVEVWRVEKMKIVPWPKHEMGNFFEGDSYICLKTSRNAENPDDLKLYHDIHFWLGKTTSIDEMGVAAYKTVELDDLMDGEPVQHRECMQHESQEFQQMFGAIHYMEGGIETGFHHVEKDAYMTKMYQVTKTAHGMKINPVPLLASELNEGDCFIVDQGENIYVFHGTESSPFEKSKATTHAENMENTRNGHSKAVIVDRDGECEEFWALLGGKPESISSKAEGEAHVEAEVGEGILHKLSDEGGTLLLVEVARGDLKSDMLDTKDIFLLDTEAEIFIWTGAEASSYERRTAFPTALKYLESKGRPQSTAIHVFDEGQLVRNKLWKQIMN